MEVALILISAVALIVWQWWMIRLARKDADYWHGYCCSARDERDELLKMCKRWNKICRDTNRMSLELILENAKLRSKQTIDSDNWWQTEDRPFGEAG